MKIPLCEVFSNEIITYQKNKNRFIINSKIIYKKDLKTILDKICNFCIVENRLKSSHIVRNKYVLATIFLNTVSLQHLLLFFPHKFDNVFDKNDFKKLIKILKEMSNSQYMKGK
jgi:hypothetical protein